MRQNENGTERPVFPPPVWEIHTEKNNAMSYTCSEKHIFHKYLQIEKILRRNITEFHKISDPSEAKQLKHFRFLNDVPRYQNSL